MMTRSNRGHGGVGVVLVLLLASATLAWAGGHWLSNSTLDGDPAKTDKAARTFDIVISLHSDPAGDNDRATVDDRTPYEEMIEHFARGVYESTNGQHKLGKVRVFTKGRFSALADVRWTASGHPSASPGGINKPGKTINMFDTFKDGNGAGSDLVFSNDRVGAGYTLAHEWGHYAYALYDEYRGGSPQHNSILYFPHTTDVGTNVAIMNSQWNARGGDFNWLNFSTSTRPGYTQRNAQYRVYEAAAWQTLARNPSRDPRRGNRVPFSRPFYSELATAAGDLATTPLPSIELTGINDATAISGLEIIWMGDSFVTVIVIDRSGSMSGTPLNNAKAAAQTLIDLAEVDRTDIGIVIFDDIVETLVPITKIDGDATRTALKNAIGTITARGLTAIGDAAARALSEIVPYGAGDENKVVFLLSDGSNNAGRAPLSVVPDYVAAGIPMFSFAYGAGADQTTLRALASQTNGQFFFSPTTLAELNGVFTAANAVASSRTTMSSGAVPTSTAQTTIKTLPVDSTIAAIDVTAVWTGQPTAVDVVLRDPQGNVVTQDSVQQSGGETLVRYAVNPAAQGNYTLELTPTADINVSVDVVATPADQITFTQTLSAETGQTVVSPTPMIMVASLQKELPITGVILNAEVEDPSGNIQIVQFRDDGVAPDEIANDGFYTALVNYDRNGVYIVRVTSDNSAGTARMTGAGLQPTADTTGTTPVELPEVPIPGAFQRAATVQVTVTSFRADDHGNDSTAATPIAFDNTDVAGRIEIAGDVDFFSFDVPADTTAATVRVTDFAGGFEPRVLIFDTDGTTVLADVDLDSGFAERGYLLATLGSLTPGTYFASVQHMLATGTGFYSFSAGPALDSDRGGVRVAGGSALRVDLWRMLLPARGLDALHMRGMINGANLQPLTDGMTFSSSSPTAMVTEMFLPGDFRRGRGAFHGARSADGQRVGRFMVNVGGSSRSLFAIGARNTYRPLQAEPAIDAAVTTGALADVNSLNVRGIGPAGRAGSVYIAGVHPLLAPELFVDSLVLSSVGSAPNRDSARLVARIPGGPRYNAANDTLLIRIGTFEVQVPPGAAAGNRPGTLFTHVVDLPDRGRVIVRILPDRRQVSLQAVNVSLGALTADVPVTVSYGAFGKTNMLGLQERGRGQNRVFVY
ncbi:MAG: DVUA0089 family protein [Candidatus Sumerlaeia bacterium]|nr:DVUA0089 family protein [Candidatus Sumerlaeia bacterium]